MANKSFEVVNSSSSNTKKYIIIGVAAAVVLFILIKLVLGFFSEEPAPTPPPAPPVATKAPAPPAATKPGVQVVAKDPAKQAEVDQQLEQLRYFIANPTMDDANITVQWLSQKYSQPPDVVVRDLFVMIERLEALSDAELAAFFTSDQNPWLEDQGYNSIIKFITYREYLSFVKKCATLYQNQNLKQG